MFAKHHYLSHSHNNTAHVYVCYINDQLAGFLSVIHFPHPTIKDMKKVHRLVILPDYQGAGFGLKLLNEIGILYKEEGYRYAITTSTPAFVYALKKYDQWICKRKGRLPKQTGNKADTFENMSSNNRITTTWEMI